MPSQQVNSLINIRYIKGVFPTNQTATIAAEFCTKSITLKNQINVRAQIWDTAGQEKYKSLVSQ